MRAIRMRGLILALAMAPLLHATTPVVLFLHNRQ